MTKPELGHLQKAGAPAMKHLREFKVRCCTCCTVHCVVWGDCTVAGRQQPAILHFAAQMQGLVEAQVEGPRGGLAELRSPLGHYAAKCSNFLSITLCFGVQVKDVSGFEAGQQLKVEDMFQVCALFGRREQRKGCWLGHE